jgi:hypothetical protein
MLTYAMLTHADVSAGGPAAKVALSLAGRRQQGDAGRHSVCVLYLLYLLYWYTSFTCFTGTPVRPQGDAGRHSVCVLYLLYLLYWYTSFTCFTGTPVRPQGDAGRHSACVLYLLYWYTSTNTDRDRGLLQAILSPDLSSSRMLTYADAC